MFLYAFVSGVSISFLHLFLRFLNKVHRSSTVAHALIHPIFIHRILLFLGLANFPTGEPVHVIAPIGATFLRQMAAHLRVGSTRPRGESSSVVPPPPSSTGANTAEESGAATVDADVPLPTTSDDSDIRHTLNHVLTVQATHGQILVNVLDEIRASCAESAQFRRSSDLYITRRHTSRTRRANSQVSNPLPKEGGTYGIYYMNGLTDRKII